LDLWSTAKPFLEKWMLEQVGPQRLWHQLKVEAPRLAKMLPELPRLVHAFLQRDHESERKQLMELLNAQRKTNQTLQTILLLSLGFFAGIVITAVLGFWSLLN
jgi:ubiquinone biosynthesis protein